MATPVAHAAAGLASLALVHVAGGRSAGRPQAWLWMLCVAAACAPDLDILASWWFTGNLMRWHSGPTHSLAFVAAAAVLAAGLAPARPGRVVLSAAVGLAVASHVLIDLLTGPQWGWHRSFGVPALWPWLDDRLTTPLTVFRGVKHGSVAIWFTPHNLGTALSELVFALPVCALSLAVLRRRPST